MLARNERSELEQPLTINRSPSFARDEVNS